MRARRPRPSDQPRQSRSLRPRRATRSAVRPHRGGHDGAAPRSAGHRSTPADSGAPGGEQAPTSSLTPEARARQGGGPDDLARYSCACGYMFDAQVSTSVHCPHCGDTQAW